MNEMKQPDQSREKIIPSSVFWGTLTLDVVAMLVFGYFLVFLQGVSKTPIVLVGMAIFLTSFLAALSSLVLTIRGRQKLGAEIVLYSLAVLGVTMIAIFQGRTPTASLSIFTISIITILSLLPRESRRRYLTIPVISMIVMWLVEWANPSWRIQLGAATIGPVAVIVFTAVLVGMLIYQARDRIAASLRYKLVTAFIATSFLAVGAVGIVTNIIATSQLDLVLGDEFSELASRMAKETGSAIINSKTAMDGLALNKFVQDTVEETNLIVTSDLATLNTLDEQWRAADDTDPLITGVLENELASELLELQARLPQYAELFITDRYGAVIASTNRTSDYYQADEEWWQKAWSNGRGATFVSQPVFDESAGIYAIDIALPIPAHSSDENIGVLRATVNINELANVLSASQFGETGEAILVLPNNQYLTREIGTELSTLTDETIAGIDAMQGVYGEVLVDGVESLVSRSPVTTTNTQNQELIEQLNWSIIIHQDLTEAHAPITATTRGVVFVAILVMLSAGVVALYMGGQFVRPVENLTATAAKIAQGDLTATSVESSQDEIGILANTFNSMTAQLRGTLSTLEERVAARTRNLQLAAEVGRSVSQVRQLDVMLKDACELILKEFSLYYVQVYLTDPSRSNLKLEAGTGSVGAQLVGRGHSLPMNTGSINGRAAIEKRSVVIADTAQSSTFRQNPLLPETRGEMAVPLVVANQVVGVLDMQSQHPGVLTNEVLPAFEALAGQLAVAVQNASLLAETEQARAQVEEQARYLINKGWHEHLDAIHKPEELGFVFDNNNVSPWADTDQAQSDDANTFAAPIAVTGEALGSLVVEFSDKTHREQTNELVTIVARQVAQQIENLRLLESAERYRYESEQVTRRQTVEGWQKYMEARPAGGLGFFYDTNTVSAQHNGNGMGSSMFSMPLKARDEMIGKLSVQGLTEQDQDSVGLVNAVAERLSAHIENLRLFEETRHGQLELDRRAKQLGAVAEISTASSQELDVAKLLDTVVHLTQRQFGLYHAHVFVYNETTQALEVAACGWDEGNVHEGTHEDISIPLNKEQSLVARAARTGRAVIVNDVKGEPGFLANPRLPDTASEMAVPLVVGDQVLGVLDVQADRINAFTEEDANIQTTLAAQVATAMQNARSFTRAQKQAEREAMLNIINQKIQSATSVEAVLQIAARELGHALGAPMAVAQLSLKDKAS